MSQAFTTLIDARTLAQHFKPSEWALFDCRYDLVYPDFGRKAYLESHLPGACFIDVGEDLSGVQSGWNGRHPLPDPYVFAVKLGMYGVTRDTQVVAYDDADGMMSARLWWLLRWIGHTKVAVLDGGLQAWSRSACALSTDMPAVSAAVYQPEPNDTAWVDAQAVRLNLDNPQMLIVDARSPDRFRGENETLDPVGGHIPGAVNRFFRENLQSDYCFKPAEILRQEFEPIIQGWKPDQVVHQCGSGITACHNLLAMEIAGLQGTRLYPGSWSEWCMDETHPVARG